MPRLRSRTDEQATTRVDLHEFAPPLIEFLGRAAYVELTLFENLSRAISTAPSVAAKASIGRAAELTLARHRALIAEIVRAGSTPAPLPPPLSPTPSRAPCLPPSSAQGCTGGRGGAAS